MQREIKILLNHSDFEVSKTNRTDAGQWFVMTSPDYHLGDRLQAEASKVRAPNREGVLTLVFENLDGTRWADHEDLLIPADEFWATTYKYKGEERPVNANRKSWTFSRGWIKCKVSAAKKHYPEIFVVPTVDEILHNVSILRPSPVQRALAKLHDAFGYPRIARVTFDVLMEHVSCSAS